MNENFLAALKAENILARVHWLAGGHQFPLVQAAVPVVLADAVERFSVAASR